jgi:GNAT superfamily N-acetyltransferase
VSHYRRSYAADAGLCERVFDLLDTWLPELRQQRRRAERLDWRWEDASTPFVYTEAGRVIAHVGLLELPLWLLGAERRVGGIHAVCTLKERRRQGHYRRLMEEVLAYCEGRYETLVLTTESPAFYTPFGFRVVDEWRFVARVRASGGGSGLRPLDLDAPADLASLDRGLARRTPISDVVGVMREEHVFKFNRAHGGLYRSDALDLVVALEREGRRLIVHDLVGPEMHPLDALLAELAQPADEIVLCFGPDRLAVETHTAPLGEDDGVLMVRGRFEAEGRPFMLPPTARH